MFLSNVRTRPDRRHQHPAGAAVRLRRAVPARQVGQPAVDRRGRLRHHRRFVGHHGREHLPPPQLRRGRRAAAARSGSSGPAGEVERSLFFSTIIMVCALLPLFTMKGPEGQIFGPMADTYAFALGGALLLALTLSPVLCLLLLPATCKPARDNFLVRWLKAVYLWQLRALPATTAGSTLARLRRPGRRHRRCVAAAPGPRVHARAGRGQPLDPRHLPGQRLAGRGRPTRPAIARGDHAEVSRRSQLVAVADRPARRRHRPDRLLQRRVLRAAQAAARTGPVSRRRPAARQRPRTKAELVEEMNDELTATLVGVDWNFSQIIRDNVMEVALRRQGRKLGQDLRPRPGRAGTTGRAGQDGAGGSVRASRTSASSASRAVEPGVPDRPATSARCGTSASPTSRTSSRRRSAASRSRR